jgi:hypothetical protein
MLRYLAFLVLGFAFLTGLITVVHTYRVAALTSPALAQLPAAR